MRYVVTGANRGLGLEFVRQLCAKGDQIEASCREPQEAAELDQIAEGSEGRVRVRALDVADADSVARFVEALEGPIDVLINNAGVYPKGGEPGSFDWDAFARGFEVNAIAPLRLADALCDRVAAGSGGVIMSVTSQMGSIEDNTSGGSYAYRASKAALNMLMRSFARDVAARGVTAFVVHPGWVKTDMGGPRARLTVEQSVQGMLSVLGDATQRTAGRFMNWDGSEIAW